MDSEHHYSRHYVEALHKRVQELEMRDGELTLALHTFAQHQKRFEECNLGFCAQRYEEKLRRESGGGPSGN